jgi:hypothetical protein
MKPLLHDALTPDIPIRPRMRPMWMTWGPVLLLIVIGAGVAYGFSVADGPQIPRKGHLR